jgi:hypothetical protein
LDELVEAILDLEPVTEEYGEHFLEVILKTKHDMDFLPNVLKGKSDKYLDLLLNDNTSLWGGQGLVHLRVKINFRRKIALVAKVALGLMSDSAKRFSCHFW